MDKAGSTTTSEHKQRLCQCVFARCGLAGKILLSASTRPLVQACNVTFLRHSVPASHLCRNYIPHGHEWHLRDCHPRPLNANPGTKLNECHVIAASLIGLTNAFPDEVGFFSTSQEGNSIIIFSLWGWLALSKQWGWTKNRRLSNKWECFKDRKRTNLTLFLSFLFLLFMR